MKRSVNGIIGWIIIACLSVILLFCIIWFFPNSNKGYYKAYKKYESKVNAELKKTTDEVEKYKKQYYENKLSKRQMIIHLEQAANRLDRTYDSFKWKRGDEVTKELYTLKKQIIITYAQVYRNKARSLEKKVYYNEKDEMSYISTIVDRYNTKDKLQKEKFNIDF